MKVRQLESALSSLAVFEKAKWRLEQYPTSPELAARLLHSIAEEIKDRTVADLGTGTGILALGAALLGAKEVLAFDVDPDALKLAKENYAVLFEDEDDEDEDKDDEEKPKVRFFLADIVNQEPPWTTEFRDPEAKEDEEEDSDSDEEDHRRISKKRSAGRGGGLRGGRGGRGRGGRGGRGHGGRRGGKGHHEDNDDDEEDDEKDEDGGSSSDEESGEKRSSSINEVEQISRRLGLADTVLMNPPFGTKNNEGIDVAFLRRGIQIATRAVYSFHKSSTRKFLLKKGEEWGCPAEVVAEMKFDIPQMYSFHKKKSVDVFVDILRFDCSRLPPPPGPNDSTSSPAPSASSS